MFTESDHADLLLATDLMAWSADLINGVMDRHPHDLTMQVVSFLCEAIRDARLGEREIGMADRYIGWSEPAAPMVKHEHEAWMIEDGCNGPYCRACGERVTLG